MAFADDLLEQARHLANRERKKPRLASLRRAVSTAYYALFHLRISEATLNWKRVEHRESNPRTRPTSDPSPSRPAPPRLPARPGESERPSQIFDPGAVPPKKIL